MRSRVVTLVLKSGAVGVGHIVIASAILVASAGVAVGQDAGTSSAPGFSMAAPPGWHSATREQIVDTIGQIGFTAEQLQALLADFSRSAVIVSYMKYGLEEEHSGLIPRVQVDVIRHTTTTFDQFRVTIVRSVERLKEMLDGFELSEVPTVVRVGGRQAVLMKATFRLPGEKSGTWVSARSRTYAVPNGDTFFQINFSDGPDDDCAALFDELVQTVRFQ